MNALVAHGGGPTAVINASLAGLVEECRRGTFSTLYGARFGVEGLLTENWLDLLACDPDLIANIAGTPGSALGSSRRRLCDDDYDRMLALFRRRDIRCFFYTGGNGSMSTAAEVARRARAAGFELQVIGIPKTIDNDLCITDHTPGYPSTAHFFAAAARDVGEDNRSLPSPICVLETLGRNAGWIVASTCFARPDPLDGSDDAPHLIYFPERPLSVDRIAADVEGVFRRLGRAVIAVCEGQLDDQGLPFGADVDRADDPAHRLSSNLGHTLAGLLHGKLGIRARAEKPGLFGRSCGEFATELDRREARKCGKAAAIAAAGGHSAVMVAIRRDSDDPYHSGTFLAPLDAVSRTERLLPADWIAEAGNNVAEPFIRYAKPLLPLLRHYQRLEPTESRP
jgi:6-phosphofructokinase 1